RPAFAVITAVALVPDGADAPGVFVIGRMLREIEDGVTGWKLEGMGRVGAPAPATDQAAVVIAGETELGDAPAVVRERLGPALIPAVTAVVGANRIVQIPEQAALLMLDISVVRRALPHHLPAVRHAVLVVVEVGVES